MNRLIIGGASLFIALVACGCMGSVQLREHAEPIEAPPSDKAVKAALEEDEGPSDAVLAEAEALWQRSLSANESGDALFERRVLRRLVREGGETSRAQQARIRLADDALARGDWGSAHALVAPLSERGQVGYTRFRIKAMAYEGAQDYGRAAEAWLAASKEAEGDDARREALLGAAQGHYLRGELREARVLAASTGSAEVSLREAISGKLTETLLSTLLETLEPQDPDRAWLALRHAQLSCEAGHLIPCKRAAQVALGSTDPGLVADATRVLERVQAWDEVHPSKLGVLLPLSGRFQVHGQAALESIQQALRGAPHIKLVVRDTGGKAGRAAQGAEELVLDEHVVGILGPIGEIEGRAAVESAGRFRVPHVVLSSNPSVTEDISSAFRLRLSAGEKVKALARYAVTQLGIKRAALLVPDQASRRRQMAAFWDEFVRLGGEVRAAEVYASEARDFKPIVGGLLGIDKPQGEAVDFDALFIPDDAQKVRRLVPFLKYFGVRTKTGPEMKTSRRGPAVQLLGVEAWNSPAVIDGEGLTNNAVFMDTFFHDPDVRHVHDFVRGFYTRHRRKPNAFQAEVFDSVNVLASAMSGLQGGDHTTRERLLVALLGTKHHEGVTGHMTLLDSGKLILEPRVLTVHLEEIRLRVSEEEEAYLRRQPRSPR